jgi:hypothetical protein
LVGVEDLPEVPFYGIRDDVFLQLTPDCLLVGLIDLDDLFDLPVNVFLK